MARRSPSSPSSDPPDDDPRADAAPEPLLPLQSPLDRLRARLSLLAGGHDDADSDAGSEYELLLDPNLPADYSQRHQPLPRRSLTTTTTTTTTIDDATVTAAAEPKRLDDGDGENEDDILLASLDAEPGAVPAATDADADSDSDSPPLEDSPYPEVRAAVRPVDDPTLPCNTLRAWTIGLSLILLGASMNTLFSLRAPSISLGALIAQVIAWPLGHAWARFVPDRELRLLPLGRASKPLRIRLNPGPFNIKEHAVIVVMASVSFSVAYATDIILAQKVFYKQDFGIVWQLLLTVSTQSLGYGIAGMMRRFLGEGSSATVV